MRTTMMRVPALAVIAALAACGGGGGASGGAMPSPEDPEAFVEAYEGMLEDMLETAREIEDADDAREAAEEFSANARLMRDATEEMQGEHAMALAGAFAAHAERISDLGRELGLEMTRIQSDPAMREAFADVLRTLEEGS